MSLILGLDIGGANTKYALINTLGELITAGSEYFPFWKDVENYENYLLKLKNKLEAEFGNIEYVSFVTTAELADCFQTKKEGITAICNFVLKVFNEKLIKSPQIYSTVGLFITANNASENWLEVSASNWMVSAKYLGMKYPNSLMIDIGSTTADIIPIHNGEVVAQGRNDLERLISGELVYSGMLRTNVISIVQEIKLRGKIIPLSSELFATTGDVYLILEMISEEEFNVETADGKTANIKNAQARLARIICADVNQISEEEIKQIALQIKNKHKSLLSKAFNKILEQYRETFQINPEFLLLGSGGSNFGLSLLRENGIYEQILINEVYNECISTSFAAYATAQIFIQEFLKK
ncbi:MAG TPA: hydantoinase/oxoprolinase family protein [candidate division Zixibacteria bacterium]|nr:hydantoinase/oxoprolinase family protein [candidate division Zixibacteria bacterium]